MEEKVNDFKAYWASHKAYISLELEDYEIAEFIEMPGSIEVAVNRAVDYQLSQGIGEVKE